MTRILVTGKQGQVGFELLRSLSVLGEVIAVGRDECDLADEHAVAALLDKYAPDVIVNPAAYTAVDRAETEREMAFAINATAPAVMAAAAVKSGALLVHFSTDYVYDGDKAGAYLESDDTGPRSVYGQSKLAGEQAIAASGARHLIFRTSWVFGAHGNNFAKTMLRLAGERESLKVVADQFGAPTAASVIADVTAQVIGQYLHAKSTDAFPYGIYHLAAAGETNWRDYAVEVVDQARALGAALKLKASDIEPIPTSGYPLPAPRPANSRLSTDKLRDTFGLALPEWRDTLQRTLQLML
ncbi:dTDP-4-dehydrorhamnose reductase [Silvimonas sp.]|uniref:dTDP-4-dehydrorhamnose reductase n=1 Tax=Silvimonas sp. TaxID=2650811 RepID=UPI0028511AE7|nr:dTDP-4-dehydrorhamnose reductase [Silvimonas sp.]MDR3429442.1 dTDP-4-dehydrorhamnose reductase [Silvimonas sp.]